MSPLHQSGRTDLVCLPITRLGIASSKVVFGFHHREEVTQGAYKSVQINKKTIPAVYYFFAMQ